MRFTHLDILEQCFHDKFRGYSKQEVDTFLHLVADDFKEMTEEIAQLKKDLERREQEIGRLQEDVAVAAAGAKGNGQTAPAEFSPEAIKERAKRIISLAKEQADQHRRKAEEEVSAMRQEIERLRDEKLTILQNLKADAKHYLESLRKKGGQHVASDKKR